MSTTNTVERYKPLSPPADFEGSRYVYEELIRISSVLDAIQNGRVLTVKHTPPEKPRTGVMVIADGTDWDPGEGRGVYYYDEERSPNWVKIA